MMVLTYISLLPYKFYSNKVSITYGGWVFVKTTILAAMQKHHLQLTFVTYIINLEVEHGGIIRLPNRESAWFSLSRPSHGSQPSWESGASSVESYCKLYSVRTLVGIHERNCVNVSLNQSSRARRCC
jgi:hypothetical protein